MSTKWHTVFNMEFRELIKELVKLYSPDVYMELGVKEGYTFNTIAPMVARAIAIDIRQSKGVCARPNVDYYIMSTDEFAKIWNDPIDVLFIDACHDYEQVKKDFDNFAPYVNEFGLVLLHDTFPVRQELIESGLCGTAYKFAIELRENPLYSDKYESCTLTRPCCGLTIVRRYRKGLYGYNYQTV